MYSLDWQYAPLTTNFGSSRSEPPWPLSSLQEYNPSKFCWFAVMKLPSVHLVGVHLAGVHPPMYLPVHLPVHLSVFLASVHRAHLGRGMRAGGGRGCFHPPPHVVERRDQVRGLMVGDPGEGHVRELDGGTGLDNLITSSRILGMNPRDRQNKQVHPFHSDSNRRPGP